MAAVAQTKKMRTKKRFDIPQAIIILILCIWGLIILYPFYNAVLMSIVPYSVYVREPFLLYPPAFDFSSYQFIFSYNTLLTGFRTTIIVLIFGLAYNMLITVTMAYVMSKPIPGRRAINVFIMFTTFFGGGMIPGYMLIKDLGLINNIGAMILPYGLSVYNMIIMRSYFYTIPEEMSEAAQLDGAGELRILVQIYLPLSTPMLATIALYFGVDRWNEWYNGMLYMRNVDKWPLQLVIKQMLDNVGSVVSSIPYEARPTVFPSGIQMAGVIVAMVPVACIYPFLQKYFVKGLTLGGVKG